MVVSVVKIPLPERLVGIAHQHAIAHTLSVQRPFPSQGGAIAQFTGAEPHMWRACRCGSQTHQCG